MKPCSLAQLPEPERRLVLEAVAARRKAYAPYSHYKVGAALLDEKGAMHSSCNVEGADYTLTTHAEMGAINAMVRSGVLRLKMMAVAVQSGIGWGMPCGLCRQKIREFAAGTDVPVLGIKLDEKEEIFEIWASSLEELLPYSFGPEHL
ncbi:MAG TPA: cytidine deaminase [Kiritimatiellia bacterium]|nr:cytidine deaminase [Kiritimatiellia bacterium]HRZ13611.1 cytidine deaminase [Kiritimatiellia bacterium]HSA19293.1 cytidine deaminase [Kiritimatiellia bacterium]